MAGGRNPVAKLQVCTETFWIGVDRGVSYLLERGIEPMKIFGDFDSIDEKHRSFVETFSEKEVYQSQKDETDLELALEWAMKQNPMEIQIYGATGYRLDHELSTLDLMYYHLSSSIKISMLDEQNEMFFLLPGCYTFVNDPRFEYISFLSYLSNIKALTLEGFKYPLEKHLIEKGKSLTISNEFHKDEGTISFDSGILLVIKSTDSKLDLLF